MRVARAHLHLPFDVSRALSALVLAGLLYVFVANQTNAEAAWQTSFTVPVELVNVPAGLAVTQQPSPVRVNLTATQQEFQSLQPASFTAQMDAASATVGDNDLPVTVRSTDPNVSNINADPPDMSLHLEQIEQRNLPVQVQVSGAVPSGYQLGQTTASPDSVTISGRAGVVEQATAAVIGVNVAGMTTSVNGAYTTSIVDAQGTPLRDPSLKTSPPSVSVQIPISQMTQYKQVGVQPVTQGVPAQGFVVDSISVDAPAVTLVGSAAGLATDSVVQTQPIDVSGISSTTVRQVGLAAPSGSLLLQPAQTVTATVDVIPIQLTESVQLIPSVTDTAADTVAAATPAPVSLTITGSAPNLAALGAGQLQVNLDAGGGGPGHYSLTPQVQNLPAGIVLDSVNPQQVSVDLVSTDGAG